MSPCGYTASHVTRYMPLTFVTLRAAEDEGRTQHEGQQRERGVRLVNIFFWGEHIS